jgi:RNA polymerase sigma-70 factor (ECF subfamily)
MPNPRLNIVPPPNRALADRDDDTLMLLSNAGRAEAFAVLVERYMKRLASLCSRLVCDRRAGEDLAQEIWLQVWACRSRYKPCGKFTVYLYSIARNRCRNHRRDTQRKERWYDNDQAVDAAPLAETPDRLDELLEKERRGRVNEALTQLPLALREALLFRFAEGLDYADIARIVGRTESAVRSRVYLAIERLRAELHRGVES